MNKSKPTWKSTAKPAQKPARTNHFRAFFRKLDAKLQKFFACHPESKIHNFLARHLSFDIVDDPDLLHAYAGKNYYKFLTRRFNVAGFFFSVIYLLFRKLYVAGVLIFILDILLINLIRDNIHVILPAFFLGLGVNLTLSLLIGFFANEYYLFAVGWKIGRLKRKYPGRNHDELRGICEAKGGTNSIAFTFGFFAKIISSIVLVINMLFSDAVITLDNSVSGIIRTVRSEVDTIVTEIQKSVQSLQTNIKNTIDNTIHEVESSLQSDVEKDVHEVEDTLRKEADKTKHQE